MDKSKNQQSQNANKQYLDCILQGDSWQLAEQVPSEFVQTIITSPLIFNKGNTPKNIKIALTSLVVKIQYKNMSQN